MRLNQFLPRAITGMSNQINTTCVRACVPFMAQPDLSSQSIQWEINAHKLMEWDIK